MGSHSSSATKMIKLATVCLLFAVANAAAKIASERQEFFTGSGSGSSDIYSGYGSGSGYPTGSGYGSFPWTYPTDSGYGSFYPTGYGSGSAYPSTYPTSSGYGSFSWTFPP